MTVKSSIQKLDPGSRVELFVLDVTSLGGSVHRFCSSTLNSAAITWQGNVYAPKPIEAEGFERSGSGALPQPTLRVADTSGVIGGMIRTYNDLLGAKLTRMKTLKKYLDGESEADPTAEFPQEIYYVERKVAQNRYMAEFALASLLDMQGKKLPARLVLKHTCSHIYRQWTGSAFSYTTATCPYTDTTYFDEFGESCAQADDKCGKRLSDCKLRYPTPEALPTRAFPGVMSVRR